MSETTYRIVEMAVRLVVALLAIYVVPVVTGAIKQKLAQNEVGKAVLTAQQTLWKSSGEERKEFATKVAREALDALRISMSSDQLSALIEAAVYEMKMANGTLDASTEDSETNTEESNG